MQKDSFVREEEREAGSISSRNTVAVGWEPMGELAD